MDLTRIDNLADYMDKKSLYNWFNDVLNYAESDKSHESVDEITDALYELSLRQWHVYEQLDNHMKKRIEMWIKEVWTGRTPDFIEGITGIIGILGLGNIYRYIKDSLETEEDDDIRAMIRYVIKELEGHEDNPYWNLN